MAFYHRYLGKIDQAMENGSDFACRVVAGRLIKPPLMVSVMKLVERIVVPIMSHCVV